MKAFMMSIVVMAAIGVGAHFALDSLGWSSASTYKSSNVRLN